MHIALKRFHASYHGTIRSPTKPSPEDRTLKVKGKAIISHDFFFHKVLGAWRKVSLHDAMSQKTKSNHPTAAGFNGNIRRNEHKASGTFSL